MNNRPTVSAFIGLRLVAGQRPIRPMAARLSYTREDPYAVRIVFGAGQGTPVEWMLGRDLLAAGLEGRAGLGDVKLWPSAASAASEAAPTSLADALGGVLNIQLSSPFGQAHFEAPAGEVADFLRRTYELVPAGEEARYYDEQLTNLLRHVS